VSFYPAGLSSSLHRGRHGGRSSKVRPFQKRIYRPANSQCCNSVTPTLGPRGTGPLILVGPIEVVRIISVFILGPGGPVIFGGTPYIFFEDSDSEHSSERTVFNLKIRAAKTG